jgi:hypothetical protein
MVFIDSAEELVRFWNARKSFNNEQEMLATTRRCGYFAFCDQRREVPDVILSVPELHQAWLQGWRAALDDSRKEK